MTPSAWIALATFGGTNLLLLALGWARLSARLAVIESKLDDVIDRPPQWCVDQQRRCEDRYEHREITSVGAAGHA